MDDLDALEAGLNEFEAAILADQKQEAKSRSRAVVPGQKLVVKKAKAKAKKASYDSDMSESEDDFDDYMRWFHISYLIY